MIDRQALFDKAVKGLRKQGRKSILPPKEGYITSCAYRSNDGCKCAIGMLIDDANYTPRLEEKTADHRLVIKALDIGRTSRDDKQFLFDLQRECHDNLVSDYGLGFRDSLELRAKAFSIKYGLKFRTAMRKVEGVRE